jgi:peptidoglycan/LPS O-acetylase OafA/YrhL
MATTDVLRNVRSEGRAPTITGKRVASLDGVRGFAILMVMLYHFGLRLGLPCTILVGPNSLSIGNAQQLFT